MSTDHIERWRGAAEGRCRATAWRDLVFTVATAPGAGPSVAEQTRGALALIDGNLAEAGSHRGRLLSATVYLADIASKPEMDAAWCEWIGAAANWPQRACVQAALAAGDLVEVTVIAARG